MCIIVNKYFNVLTFQNLFEASLKMLGLIVEDDVIQFIWVLVDFYDSPFYKALLLVQSFIMGFF